MNVTTASHIPQTRFLADAALDAAARFWFLVAVVGQWAFLYYIVAFYGPATVQGNFSGWLRNTHLNMSYVAGDTAGNLAFASHVLLAAVVAFGGALQLVPWFRSHAPSFHRWNGRLFLVTALGGSLAGLYLVWVRHDSPSGLSGNVALSLNATLIVAFIALSFRTALARDIAAHRRWALRLYLVANAQWFTRVGVFAWIVVNQGDRGLATFFSVWGYGCYLVPLAVLELYLRAKRSTQPQYKSFTASLLFALTPLMAAGIFGLFMFGERPLLAKPATQNAAPAAAAAPA